MRLPGMHLCVFVMLLTLPDELGEPWWCCLTCSISNAPRVDVVAETTEPRDARHLVAGDRGDLMGLKALLHAPRDERVSDDVRVDVRESAGHGTSFDDLIDRRR